MGFNTKTSAPLIEKRACLQLSGRDEWKEGWLDGWGEETHYSGFIVCWCDIFLHFVFFFLSFPFFQAEGHTAVFVGQENGGRTEAGVTAGKHRENGAEVA